MKAEDLRNTWRIILLLIVGQLIGLSFGTIFKFHTDPFLSKWVGAAIGTTPGVIFGCIWHFSNHERRQKIPYFTVSFFVFGAVFLFIGAIQLFVGGFGFATLNSKLSSLNPSNISSLYIYKGYDNANKLIITDKAKITSFLNSTKDIKSNYPQHNKDCDKWTEYYVGFSESFPKDIILEYCESEVAKGVFAMREGRTTTYHGTFTSKMLKNWLDQNVIPELGK